MGRNEAKAHRTSIYDASLGRLRDTKFGEVGKQKITALKSTERHITQGQLNPWTKVKVPFLARFSAFLFVGWAGLGSWRSSVSKISLYVFLPNQILVSRKNTAVLPPHSSSDRIRGVRTHLVFWSSSPSAFSLFLPTLFS